MGGGAKEVGGATAPEPNVGVGATPRFWKLGAAELLTNVGGATGLKVSV